MIKPDLTGVRPLSLAELNERRHRSQGGRPAKKGRFKKPKFKTHKIQKGRTKMVASVSLTPELRYRAARELGGGSLTVAVTKALTAALAALDRENS